MEKNRENHIIPALKQIVNTLHFFQGDVDFLKIFGSSTTITGTGMVIAGLVLTPFTLGGSLALTAVGTYLGVGGSLVSAGASAINMFVTRAELEKAQDLIKEDHKLLNHIQDLLKDKRVEREIIMFCGSAGKSLINGWNIASGVANLSDEAASISANLVAKTATNLPNVLQTVGIAFNLVGGLLSVFDLVTTSINVHKGSKSEYGESLEKIVEQMINELEED